MLKNNNKFRTQFLKCVCEIKKVCKIKAVEVEKISKTDEGLINS